MPDEEEVNIHQDAGGVVVQADSVEAALAALHDMDDLAKARVQDEEDRVAQPFWKKLGPGLITGAADDDPSGIGTYAVAGAQFGTALLWLVIFTLPLMIVVQEMCGRLAFVTQRGIAGAIKKHFHPSVLWFSVILLIGTNIVNVWADLNVMAASMGMLLGKGQAFWLLVVTFPMLGLMIWIPYRIYVKVLKWLCLALLAYVVVDLLPAVGVHWGTVLTELFRPHWKLDTDFLMTVVGFVGTTISPYLFFWQAGETLEEQVADGKIEQPNESPRRRFTSAAEIRNIRNDTIIGMTASQIIAFSIMVCTATVLNGHGNSHIETAQQAAQALKPLGRSAYLLFTIGIVGAGLLAVPTLAGSAAYGLCEALGWRFGLFRSYDRARGFYGTIIGVVLLGMVLNFFSKVKPIQALLYAAIANGVVAVPLIVLLLLLCNNKRVLGKHVNGWVTNVLGWITVLVMGAAAAFMGWALLTGHAS